MHWTQGLHRALAQDPDAPATVFDGRARTFREQADRVARLAGALRELGVRDGERVGILARNSDRLAELYLAVPWADGVLHPISTWWTPARIRHSINDARTGILFVDDAFSAEVPALLAGCPGLGTVGYLGDGPAPAGRLGYEELVSGGRPVADAHRAGDVPAALCYTGGTTGTPKARCPISRV
jgi:acyl-CoA synthetase (AMP-forming)/AMP-acid ligase II